MNDFGRCSGAPGWLAMLIMVMALSAGGATTARADPIDLQPPAVAGQGGLLSPVVARQAMSEVAAETSDPPATSRLLATLQALSDAPLYQDSRADLLIDGADTFAAMQAALRTAQRFIHLETYIFADDEVGQAFAKTLTAKAQDGVEVRIIYDSLGSADSASGFFDKMAEGGIDLIEYHRVNPLTGGNPMDANTRSHRKLLVVDGIVAFAGGVNLSGAYFERNIGGGGIRLQENWRDTHVEIRGPAVEGFAWAFEQHWRAQGGSFEGDPPEVPEAVKAGNDLVAVLRAEGGNQEMSAIYRAYLDAMAQATDRIWITQAYFAPDDTFMTQLTDAADRGVDVRLLVPGISDSALLLHASRSRYGDLLEQGVRIYENRTTVLHAKTAVIDGTWSTVGSSNLDYRSFLHNDEINAVIFGPDFARQMEAQFLQDIGDSVAISLEEWKQRPLLDRMREVFSWAVEYWL